MSSLSQARTMASFFGQDFERNDRRASLN